VVGAGVTGAADGAGVLIAALGVCGGGLAVVASPHETSIKNPNVNHVPDPMFAVFLMMGSFLSS
jgi:hypothetical protein